jgi:Domain of unknown function (DUF4169)
MLKYSPDAMTNIVNLNKARKHKAREEKRRQADKNRVVYGQPKDQRKLSKANLENENRRLDGHRLTGDDVL